MYSISVNCFLDNVVKCFSYYLSHLEHRFCIVNLRTTCYVVYDYIGQQNTPIKCKREQKTVIYLKYCNTSNATGGCVIYPILLFKSPSRWHVHIHNITYEDVHHRNIYQYLTFQPLKCRVWYQVSFSTSENDLRL